ncbi:MAG: hypothetical protein ACXW13_10465, partial [Burkholderiaceae bacterium]
RSVGDVAGEALSLNNLGSLHLERREYESAGAYLTPALTLCDRHGLSTTRGLVLSNLIGVSMRTDNYSDAEAWAERALDHAHSIRNRYLTSFVTLQFAYLALRRKDLPAARDHLRVALEIAISIQRPALMIEGVACFAALLAAEGHVSCARSVATFVLSHPGIGAPERMDVADAMKTWPVVDEDKVPWAGTLEELAQRIVVETDVTHAPLIAALRGTLAHH